METVVRLSWKKNGCRIFRLSYAEIQPGISYQILLKVDEQSGEVKEITVDIADLNDGSVTHITAEVQTIPKQTFKMIPAMCVPIWINYDYQYKNGTRVNVKIDNISVEYNSWTKKKTERFIKEK